MCASRVHPTCDVRDAALKGCEIWVGLRSRLLTMRPGGSAKSALSHREGRLIRPAVGHAGKHNAGGLDMSLALPLVVARIDELDRAIDHLEQRYIRWRADLQRAELGGTV